MNDQEQGPTWDRATRRTVAIILGVFVIFSVWVIRSALPSLIIAGLIAFILAPLIGFFRNRLRLPRALAVVLAYVIFVVTLLLLPLIFIPALIRSFADLQLDLTLMIETVQAWLAALLGSVRSLHLFNLELDLAAAVDPALEALNDISVEALVPSFEELLAALPQTARVTFTFVGGLVTVLTAILLTFIYSVYLSVDVDRLGRGFWNYVPADHEPELRILVQRVTRMWNAFLRGQLGLAVIIFLVTWLAGTIIGLPGAFALGVIAGVLEIIPNLGPMLAAIPAVLTAFIQGSTTLDVSNFTFGLVVIGVYVLIQQLENQLVVPRILGEAVQLPSLVVLVGVVVGFQVASVLGALIAAPTVATVREVFVYSLNKVLGRPPFPPTAESGETVSPLGPLVRDAWARLRAEVVKRWPTGEA
jgi:predicted PurR-regulated permease PerM